MVKADIKWAMKERRNLSKAKWSNVTVPMNQAVASREAEGLLVRW